MTIHPTQPLITEVLAEVTDMVTEILDNYGIGDVEIGMDTTLHDDLEMESIDLVALADLLAQRHGPQVNLPEYLADKDLAEVIGLTIGDIVSYVASQIGNA